MFLKPDAARNYFLAALDYVSFPLVQTVKLLAFLAVSFCFFPGSPPAHAANVYGIVEWVEGTVSITDDKGHARAVQLNDTVMEGETIITGNDGALQVRTSDYGIAAYRSKSKITIQSFRAEGDSDDNMVLAIVYGGLRSVSGWIGKYNRGNYAIKAPNATIGIRGTDHEPLHIPIPSPGEVADAEPGTYEKVNSGQTSLQNPAGEVIVNAGESAFASHDAKKPPQKLMHIPEIYKATSNDSKIEARKEQLAKEVEQQRAEKQNAVLAASTAKGAVATKTETAAKAEAAAKAETAAKAEAAAKAETGAKEAAAHKKPVSKTRPSTK